MDAALRDRYRIERELGRGGMATVYLAHDLRHDRPVALKVLKPIFAASLGTERFLLEIRVTARLQHPHILPLLDSGVLETAPGGGQVSLSSAALGSGEGRDSLRALHCPLLSRSGGRRPMAGTDARSGSPSPPAPDRAENANPAMTYLSGPTISTAEGQCWG